MSESTPFDLRLLDTLVCPQTHGPLVFDATTNSLISVQAGLVFPICEGVPILLCDQARVIPEDHDSSL